MLLALGQVHHFTANITLENQSMALSWSKSGPRGLHTDGYLCTNALPGDYENPEAITFRSGVRHRKARGCPIKAILYRPLTIVDRNIA